MRLKDMKTIINNDDGSFVWIPPQEKLEVVKMKLQPTLDTIAKKIENNENSLKPRKLNFNTYIATSLFNVLSVYPNVPYNVAIGIDKDTLREYILAFRELVSYILDVYCDYVCSKEQFNAFIGISYGAYNKLLVSIDPDILAEMERLEGFFGELQFAAAQTGLLKERTTETRLRADGIGHAMNLKNDDDKKMSITMNVYDPDAVNRQLGNIMGKKWIENKK